MIPIRIRPRAYYYDQPVVWAEHVLKHQKEGYSPLFEDEVRLAYLVLLGVVNTAEEIQKRRGKEIAYD